MTRHLYLFENLLNVKSHDGIFKFLDQQCDDLGYNRYIFAGLKSDQGEERVFTDDSEILVGDDLVNKDIFSNFPLAWTHRYQEEKYEKIDPVIQQASTSSIPVFWDQIRKRSAKNHVMDDAHEHGLVSGITIAVRGNAGEGAFFSMANDRAPENSSTLQLENSGMVVLTALYIHETLRRLDKKTSRTSIAPELTSREKDCLQWSACGKTSWEIAKILSISERTVVFHVTNATRKLNAANRRQAVARAISLKLIHP